MSLAGSKDLERSFCCESILLRVGGTRDSGQKAVSNQAGELDRGDTAGAESSSEEGMMVKST